MYRTNISKSKNIFSLIENIFFDKEVIFRLIFLFPNNDELRYYLL